MKTRYLFLALLFLGITGPLLAGIGTLQTTVLRPATVTLPKRIDKIFLAERSCGECIRSQTGRLIVHAPDTNQYMELGQLKSRLDSTMRYTVRMTSIDTAMRAYEKNQVLPSLSWDEVGRITNHDTTALLIVLEESDVHYSGDYAYEHRVWRVYDYASRTILDEYEHQYEYQRVVRGNNVTSYVASQAVEIYACRIMPHWENATRHYYKRGNERMKTAAYCLESNDWDGACAQWNVVVRDSTKDRDMAAKACYNLAVYFEIHNRFVEAKEWNARAVRMGDSNAPSFARIIQQRSDEESLLSQQVAANQGQLPLVRTDYTADRQWNSQSRLSTDGRNERMPENDYDNPAKRAATMDDPR